MSIPQFVVDVAAGTLSGAFVAALPLRNMNPGPTVNSVSVTGVENIAVLDQSSHHYWDITQNNTTTTTLARSASQRAESDTDDMPVLVVFLGIIAVIGFLFAWPAALGFLLGSCIATAFVYVRASSSPALRAVGLRGTSIAHSALCLVVTVATCGFALFASVDGHSLIHLDREISTQFPGYSSSIPTRMDVLTHHTSDVFTLIGWHGVVTLSAQVGALILCALLNALLALRCLGAASLCRQASGLRVGKFRQNLGTRLLTERPRAELLFTLLGGAFALSLASGLASHVLMVGSEVKGTPRGLSDPSASISTKEVVR